MQTVSMGGLQVAWIYKPEDIVLPDSVQWMPWRKTDGFTALEMQHRTISHTYAKGVTIGIKVEGGPPTTRAERYLIENKIPSIWVLS